MSKKIQVTVTDRVFEILSDLANQKDKTLSAVTAQILEENLIKKMSDIPALPQIPPLPIGIAGTIRTMHLPMHLLLVQGVKWAHNAWVRTGAEPELKKLTDALQKLKAAYEAGEGTAHQRAIAEKWLLESAAGVNERSFYMDAFTNGQIHMELHDSKYETELDSFGGDQ